MSNFYPILLTISGTLIIILLSIIGFFIARLINDVKTNIENIGKNKGQIELVSQRQESDMQRIEKTTQLEISGLSKEVGVLSGSVNNLIVILTRQASEKK